MPFAFLAPGALAALALAAVPVVVHMLRRAKAAKLEFPSLQFLAETPSIVRALAAPNDLGLLAARVAAIALVALALARPVWIGARGAPAPGAGDTILLLDASASMARGGIAESVKRLAIDRLARVSRDGRVRVAAFAEKVEWLTEWVEPELASDAIDGYAPTRALGRPAAALLEATGALAARGGGTVAIVSDFQRTNEPWSTVDMNPSIGVEPIPVGGDFANGYVASVASSRSRKEPILRVGLVEATQQGRALRVVELPLADGATADGVRIEGGGELWRAVAIAPDDLDVDDRFAIALSRPLGVAVVDSGAAAPYLTAGAEVGVAASHVVARRNVDRDALATADRALVTHRALASAGAIATLEAWVREGHDAVVFATEPVEWPFPRPGGEAAGAIVQLERVDESLVAPLRSASITNLRGVAVEPGDVAILGASGRAIAVRRALGAGSVTVVGLDPVAEKASIVLDESFPSLVAWLLRAAPPVVPSPENVDARESEPGVLDGSEIATIVARSPDAASSPSLEALEREQQGWRVALALAILAVVGELALATFARRRAETSEHVEG